MTAGIQSLYYRQYDSVADNDLYTQLGDDASIVAISVDQSGGIAKTITAHLEENSVVAKTLISDKTVSDMPELWTPHRPYKVSQNTSLNITAVDAGEAKVFYTKGPWAEVNLHTSKYALFTGTGNTILTAVVGINEHARILGIYVATAGDPGDSIVGELRYSGIAGIDGIWRFNLSGANLDDLRLFPIPLAVQATELVDGGPDVIHSMNLQVSGSTNGTVLILYTEDRVW